MDPASQRKPTGTTLSTAEGSPERPSRIWYDHTTPLPFLSQWPSSALLACPILPCPTLLPSCSISSATRSLTPAPPRPSSALPHLPRWPVSVLHDPIFCAPSPSHRPHSAPPTTRNDAREGRQLERWAEAGRDWERQENILTTKLGREPTNLMMNSEATFRRVKEKRDKLDIALSDPSVMHTFEQGKGFRVRSEYWTQAMVTKSGLQSTLTTRQRGDVTAADAFEYVHVPPQCSITCVSHFPPSLPPRSPTPALSPFFRTPSVRCGSSL
jgi:hypothetical protein